MNKAQKPSQADLEALRALMDEFQARLLAASRHLDGLADCVARMARETMG